jgi:uncharacterized protein (TIRG00374 family)
MRRKMLFLLGFVALVAGGLLVFQRDFDTNLFFQGFRNVRPTWLVAAIIGTFVSYALRAVRWQILLASLKSIRVGPLLSATLLGFCAIYTLGRAGELFRPVWIARQEAISTTGSFAAILLERVFDLLLILLLFATSLAFVELPEGTRHLASILTRTAWLVWGGATLSLICAILFERYVEVGARRLSYGRLRRFLETFATGLAATSSARRLGLVTGYSLLLWIGIALQFWVMLLGLNLNLSLPATTLVLVGSALGSIAQVPGIGGGFQAGFIFGLTTFFLVPVETAAAASLMAWLITFAPTLVVAAIYMMLKGISAHQLIAGEPV